MGNGVRGKTGVQSFKGPENPKESTLYFDGDWDIQDEYAENKTKDARIIYRYEAEKVFIVASSKGGVTIRLLLDGEPYGDPITIKEDRLYRLIEDQGDPPAGGGEHTLEIIIEEPGARFFAFTFG